MSIKTFNAFYQSGVIFIQTPLTHVNDLRHGKYVGWTTQVSMPAAGVPRLTVLRTTTFCTVGKNGPRRLIRDHPWTQDTVTVGPQSRVSLRSVTRWVVRQKGTPKMRSRYRSITNQGWVNLTRGSDDVSGYDFDTITLFRNTFLAERVGQPFVDYLTEATPIGEYLSGPGRLPYDWAEMRKWEREAAQVNGDTSAMREQILSLDDDTESDTPEEERWR